MITCQYCFGTRPDGSVCDCDESRAVYKCFENKLNTLPMSERHTAEMVGPMYFLSDNVSVVNQKIPVHLRLPWRLLVDTTINHFERSRKETWTRAEVCQRLNILHREFVAKYTEEG